VKSIVASAVKLRRQQNPMVFFMNNLFQ